MKRNFSQQMPTATYTGAKQYAPPRRYRRDDVDRGRLAYVSSGNDLQVGGIGAGDVNAPTGTIGDAIAAWRDGIIGPSSGVEEGYRSDDARSSERVVLY